MGEGAETTSGMEVVAEGVVEAAEDGTDQTIHSMAGITWSAGDLAVKSLPKVRVLPSAGPVV